jgi:hypothetical protein
MAVRRAGGQADEWQALLSGAAGGVWRWRVELALLALPVGGWWLLARPLGPLAAAAIVAWAVTGLLVSPARQDALLRLLRARRLRRRFRRAWVDGGLTPVRLSRVRTVPAGELARVRVSSGCSVEDLAERREQLAASIGLRELRVLRDPDDASRGDGDVHAPRPARRRHRPVAIRGGGAVVVVGAGTGRGRRAR